MHHLWIPLYRNSLISSSCSTPNSFFLFCGEFSSLSHWKESRFFISGEDRCRSCSQSHSCAFCRWFVLWHASWKVCWDAAVVRWAICVCIRSRSAPQVPEELFHLRRFSAGMKTNNSSVSSHCCPTCHNIHSSFTAAGGAGQMKPLWVWFMHAVRLIRALRGHSHASWVQGRFMAMQLGLFHKPSCFWQWCWQDSVFVCSI